GGGAAFAGGGGGGAGFFTRSGSHSATARAGVQSLVRTHTPAPMALTIAFCPCESTRYPWFLASCAGARVGSTAPAAANPMSVIRIDEVMIFDPPFYATNRDRPEWRYS